MHRRAFVKRVAGAAVGVGLMPLACKAAPATEPLFKISLAQWSLNKTLFGKRLDNLDFAAAARNDYGLDAVEYVNAFFMDKAQDRDYLRQMKTRADDAGVRSLLIMCDREGALGDPDEAGRIEAVERHKKWVEAAAFLGCHAVRVNAASEGSFEEQQQRAADGLHRLCEFADGHELSVLVENHGGLSSHGAWLAGVIARVDHPRIGTLPDFGNFRIRLNEWYDRYQGVAELMPFARAVSAKSHAFTEDGYEAHTDYPKMMRIVLDAGYRGYVGIEYEGADLSEPDGIRATKTLLERVRADLADDYASE